MDSLVKHDFQELVDKYLIRHRSILDILTKLSRICRQDKQSCC